jgi:hypothetical protein
VVEQDGKVIGSNCLDKRAPIACVGPITIDPAVQNRSADRQLMQAVMARAAERKFAGVRLVQAAYHNRSLSLYAKLGFAVREPLACMQGAIQKTPSAYQVRPANRMTCRHATTSVCEFTGMIAPLNLKMLFSREQRESPSRGDESRPTPRPLLSSDTRSPTALPGLMSPRRSMALTVLRVADRGRKSSLFFNLRRTGLTASKSVSSWYPSSMCESKSCSVSTAALMPGSNRSRGYCLEMICADFLAGANLDHGDPEMLLFSMTGFFRFLPSEQQQAFLEGLSEKAS